MKLIILGIQGSGKGTQSELISEKFHLKHISTGDLIRKEISEKTELGNKLKELISRGELASDKITNELLRKNLPKNNFLLDGYPRNLDQAKFLDSITEIDKVISLELSEKEVMKRLSNRFQCPNCKLQYGLNKMPKREKRCDECQTTLIQRTDDKPEAIQKRIDIFKKETFPILEYYSDRIILINGNQTVERVFKDIEKELN